MSEPDTETWGDEVRVPCPWCGKWIYIQDAWTDCVVKEGWDDECETCKKPFVVTAVDFDVTVWVDRKAVGS